MAAGTWNMTNEGLNHLLSGDLDFDSDTTFYVALLDDTPTLSDSTTTWASVSANEVSNAGYTAGGILLSSLATSGTSSKAFGDSTTSVSWTLTGTDETVKYAVLRHTTTGDVIAYVEVESGSSLIIVAGNDITVDVSTIFSGITG